MKLASFDRDRGFAIASLLGLGVWGVIAFTTWNDLANGVMTGSPWRTYYKAQPLSFDSGIQFGPIIGTIALNISAAILGYILVIYPVWGARSLASKICLVFSGIIPGTVLFIALTRLATLFVSNRVAPYLVLASTLGAGVFALSRVRNALKPQTFPSNLRPILLGSAALLVSLIFSVHLDRINVIGEGSLWFINEIFLSPLYGIGRDGHWPLVSQHYDEAAVLYPVVYGLMSPGSGAADTLTSLYWITLAFGRVGAVSISYLAIRALGVDRLSTLVLLVFLFGASLSLNPIASRLMFDSLNPLAFTAHVSRFLIPILPLLLVSAAISWKWKTSARSLVVATMLGIGLSSMPIHAALVVLWAVAVAVGTAISPEAARSSRIWRSVCSAGLIVLLVITMTYSLQMLSSALRAALLVGATAVAGGILSWSLLRERAIGDGRCDFLNSVPLLIAICCGYALGIVFLGNVLTDGMQAVFGDLWPWSQLTVVERLQSTLALSAFDVAQSPYCNSGLRWGDRAFMGHCGSLPMFVRTYGLAFVVMISVISWWLARPPGDHSMRDDELTVTMLGIVLCLLALTLSFVVFDFLSPAPTTIETHRWLSVWLRSRLLEPWFYGGSALALALFLREAETRERRWAQSAMMIGVALFALSPLILPAQFIVNTAYLFTAVLGK